MNLRRVPPAALICSLLLTAGCLPPIPENATVIDAPPRDTVLRIPGAAFEREVGLDDALWLQVGSPDGQRWVGGFLSLNEPARGAIVILLHGASAFYPDGGIGSARELHQSLGHDLQARGFITWALAPRECGTAYGQEDLADVLTALDWLERTGRVMLRVQRVYLFGFSTGGIQAVLVNRQRQLNAIASAEALTEPDSLEQNWGFWYWLTSLYPENLAACQMRSTLETYGPPGDPAWDALDTVGHIDQLQSPLIVFHGTEDPVYPVSNAQDLQAAYDGALAAGRTLPPMEFVYLDGVGHFYDLNIPEVVDPLVAFFDRFTAPLP